MTTCVYCDSAPAVSCTICDSLLCTDHGTSVRCQVGGDAERVCEDREACRMIADHAARHEFMPGEGLKICRRCGIDSESPQSLKPCRSLPHCDVCGVELKDGVCQTFDCPESSQFSDWADSWHDDVDRSDPLDALVEEMELDAP